MKESNLFIILRKALRSMGFKVYGEVPLGYGSAIDLVAEKDGYTIGVELKLTNSQILIRQAKRTKKYTDMVFVATKSNPNDRFIERLEKGKIGFILIDEKKNVVEMVLEGKKNTRKKKRLLLHPAYLNQIGGIPSKGQEKRRTLFQQLQKDVESYLKARKEGKDFESILCWVRKHCDIKRQRLKNVLTSTINLVKKNEKWYWYRHYLNKTSKD